MRRIRPRAFQAHRSVTLFSFSLVLVLLSGLTACTRKRSLSIEEERQLSQLKEELQQTTSEIESTEAADRKYSGGLIKALIEVRLEVLKSTQILIQQRIGVIEAGSPITLVVETTRRNPIRAQELEAEIVQLSTKIQNARLEGARYSGGVVAALKESAIATDEQSLALLQRERLIAKYGLHLPISSPGRTGPDSSPKAGPDQVTASSSMPPSLPATPPQLTPPQPSTETFEVVGVDARVTESNSTWSRYAWKLTLRNPNQRALALDATIQFLDKDGFVVDDARAYDLSLSPLQEKVFTGYKLIDASSVPRVRQVKADLKAK